MSISGFQLERPLNITVSNPELSDHGIPKERSKQKDLQRDRESFLFPQATNQLENPQKSKEKRSVTVEYHHRTKRTTLKDKLNLCGKNFPNTKSGMMLDLDLIGTDQSLTKFWNAQKREISQRLWLPIETDCADSPLNSSKTCLACSIPKSWSSIKVNTPVKNKNYLKTCSQSSKSILVKETEEEDIQKTKILKTISTLEEPMKENKRTEYIDKVTKSYNDKIENCKDKKKILRLINSRDVRIQYFKNIKQDPFKVGRAKMLENSLKPIRARKIRFYPNREQKTVFRKWIGTYRYLYNKILNLIISGKEEPNPTNLRNKYVPKNRVSEEEKWMLEVPKEVRVEAIKEACKNLITNKKRVKEGGITHFKMKYKRKKNLRQTISIPKSAFFHSADTFKIYPKILGDQKLFRKHDTSKNDRKLFATNYDIKIMMEKPNYWTLIVPHEVSPKKNGKVENQDFPIISLDPGLRTFLTGYSPDVMDILSKLEKAISPV